MLLHLFLACAGGGTTDTGPGGKSDAETHPLVPEAYADLWDIESLGCADVTVYWAFEGEIDDAGAITGQETWYWFFSEEGWDADCADTFDVTGVEEPTPIPDNPCLSCDRAFTTTYEMPDENRGCPLEGYEQLFDNDTRDRIDEEIYTFALMLDTNPLGGEPGELNLWSWSQDDQSETTWWDRALGTGTLPVEAATSGPGALTWVLPDGMCIEIEEED